MATRKRKTNHSLEDSAPTESVTVDTAASSNAVTSPVTSETKSKVVKPKTKSPKYIVGSIVYISKEAGADLNGFKLFPQYKKYTYTVEAYDEISGVYSLRRLNLSLKLKEADIVAPNERAHDSLNRRQF